MDYKAYLFFLVWMISSWCSASSLTRRMAGGTKTTSDNFPFQVLVILDPRLMKMQSHVTAAGGTQCGGAIISEDTVLTAAHCVPERNHAFYTVTGQIDDPADRESEHALKLIPTKIITHEEFDKKSLVNDLAIIKIQSSHGLRPIKFGYFEKRPGYRLNLASWGSDPFQPTVSYLRELTINVLDDRECIRVYGHYYAPDREICAMGKDLYNTFLAGDSGSPVILNEELVGIISYNVENNLREPGALTDISRHKEWIQRHLPSTETEKNPSYSNFFENEKKKNGRLGSHHYSPSSNYYKSQNQMQHQPQYFNNHGFQESIQSKPTPSKHQENFWSRSPSVQGKQRGHERTTPSHNPSEAKNYYQAPNKDYENYNQWRQKPPKQHNTAPQYQRNRGRLVNSIGDSEIPGPEKKPKRSTGSFSSFRTPYSSYSHQL